MSTLSSFICVTFVEKEILFDNNLNKQEFEICFLLIHLEIRETDVFSLLC